MTQCGRMHVFVSFNLVLGLLQSPVIIGSPLVQSHSVFVRIKSLYYRKNHTISSC